MDKNKSFITNFIPPEGYLGEMGIVTTMSHDDETLKLIIESFTSKSINALKTIDTRCFLYMIADRKSDPINYSLISGIKSLYYTGSRLLHAKTAVLKFYNPEADDCIYRLILFTGNFTRASLNRQIEMIWSEDYDCKSPYGADLISMAKFLDNLIIKNTQNNDQTNNNINSFLTGLKVFRKPRAASRFIHSLEEPLEKQFLKFCNKHKTKNYKHNSIWFGTPFFQQDNLDEDFVLNNFIKYLRRNGVLSSKSKFFLQTNSSAVSFSIINACEESDIEIRGIDSRSKRTLHSKFIIISSKLDGCLKRNIIYIGSGNLTVKGFSKKLNIEAGIMIYDDTQYLTKDVNKYFYIGSKIGNCVEYNPDESEDILDDDVIFHRVLECMKDNHVLTLYLSRDRQKFTVLSAIDHELYTSKLSDQNTIEIEIPKDVEIFDTIIISEENGQTYPLPVMDINGNFNKIKIEKVGFNESLTLLKSFPNLDVSEGDDDDEIALPTDLNESSTQNDDIKGIHDTFPIFNLSQLIEHISRENENINEYSIEHWCSVLKYTLINKLKNAEKKRMAELNVNKLDTLLEDGFRPDLNGGDIENYKHAINAIKEDWSNENEKTTNSC